MTTIITAVLVVGGLGLIIGILLGVAGKIFFVKTDERIGQVREQLPGSNCGGCGYAGCDALAKAIVDGIAPPNSCTAGCGPEQLKQIGRIIGQEVEAGEKYVMFVKCDGRCDVARDKYDYYGEMDCRQAAVTPGKGPKMCSYGCMGFGSCIKVCKFDAISIKDNIAVIDPEKCVNCGRCIEECPNHVIERIAYSSLRKVQCNNHDKGKNVKLACDKGCIGCGLCAKVCEESAITMDNNLPVIDNSRCTNCRKCIEKCPVKCIL